MATSAICVVDGCDNPQKARGYCTKHYLRWKRHGHPTAGRSPDVKRTPGQLCAVEDCGALATIQVYCSAHYQRIRRHGSPVLGRTSPGCVQAWLEAHVDYNGDECLVWPFARAKGYARIRRNGQNVTAYRVMALLAHGEPPTPKHHAAHSCGNGPGGCVNPRHLRWATASENQRDRVEHGNSNRGERCGSAKLTEEDVRRIVKQINRVKTGVLASQYGVNFATIRDIEKGRTWKWLTKLPTIPKVGAASRDPC